MFILTEIYFKCNTLPLMETIIINLPRVDTVIIHPIAITEGGGCIIQQFVHHQVVMAAEDLVRIYKKHPFKVVKHQMQT